MFTCVMNKCKSSQETHCCVQVRNKEFCTLLHNGDFLLFYGNSGRASKYVDIIFLKNYIMSKDDA